ncbi:MAG: transposase [Candidatus Poribacteria bacterium]|nr:transposase [Candidatus Poribacteria bacterium]
MRYSRKRANPKKIIAGFQEVFKGVCVKKTSQRNFLLTVIAVSVSKTFRINAIASRLPIDVVKEKSKQKRLLRFLETPFPCQEVIRARLASVLGRVWCSKRARQQGLILIDETDLPVGWKALVASASFRNRSIPIDWHIYKNEEISDGTYKSHNEIIQKFCVALHEAILQATDDKSVEPVYVFDRGFARARYVIKFLDDRGITVVMRVPRNVGVHVDGSLRKLDDLEEGGYSDILYQATEALPLTLYVVRDEAHEDLMYLISNRIEGRQIHADYKRRMQVEHGFRDIKSCFNFKDLVLKKSEKPRSDLLFWIVVFAYGLLFLTYEKAAGIWAKTFQGSKRKIYSVITIIKKGIDEMWTHETLLLFTQQTCLRNLDFLTP